MPLGRSLIATRLKIVELSLLLVVPCCAQQANRDLDQGNMIVLRHDLITGGLATAEPNSIPN